MRIGTLSYSTRKAEGTVRVNWGEIQNSMIQLDILQDWLCLIQDAYMQKRDEVFDHRRKERLKNELQKLSNE